MSHVINAVSFAWKALLGDPHAVSPMMRLNIIIIINLTLF